MKNLKIKIFKKILFKIVIIINFKIILFTKIIILLDLNQF
jgi:hypothetical protein